MIGLLALVAVPGCVGTRVATPPPKAASTYEVVIAAANGPRRVAEAYTLEVVPGDRDIWVFRTTHSEGEWEDGPTVHAFDSDARQRSDPWPLLQQYAISAVATPIQFADDGTLLGIVEPDAWSAEAHDALGSLELPVQAAAAGKALVDPDGVVRDLARNFPGTPSEGEWVRTEVVAGLRSTRIEQCVPSEERGTTLWTCEGRVEGPRSGQARLHDVTTWTKLALDRDGLVSLEGSYAGTLVLLDPEHQGVLDRAIAGRRLVQRR